MASSNLSPSLCRVKVELDPPFKADDREEGVPFLCFSLELVDKTEDECLCPVLVGVSLSDALSEIS